MTEAEFLGLTPVRQDKIVETALGYDFPPPPSCYVGACREGFFVMWDALPRDKGEQWTFAEERRSIPCNECGHAVSKGVPYVAVFQNNGNAYADAPTRNLAIAIALLKSRGVIIGEDTRD